MLCDMLMIICYVHSCLVWGLTRYVWLFYDLLCYVGILCYGPEGDMLWAGRRYVLDRKGVFVVGIFGGISLSFRAYSCGFMFSGSQESAARQRRDHTVPRRNLKKLGDPFYGVVQMTHQKSVGFLGIESQQLKMTGVLKLDR
uniref:Uncharacterized protein n=1 Tax=Lactuca sativa TaxID=4236 RepID=A0A9R1WJ01_LACSA|nr:hypothetical protein LSAT_V11C200066820 [Lactuca sativa]